MHYGLLVMTASALFVGLTRVQAQLSWLWWWPASSFFLVGLGYFGLGAGMLGKKPGGGRQPWAYVTAGPFLLFMKGLRRVLLRLRRDEAPYDLVGIGVYVGRVPRFELPAEVRTVVDMTSEFRATSSALAKHYVCLPTLDGAAPAHAALLAALQQSNVWDSAIYVHCAAGHGRSALFAACLLVAKGDAADVDEAMRQMKRARPRVHLTSEQHRSACLAVAALKSAAR